MTLARLSLAERRFELGFDPQFEKHDAIPEAFSDSQDIQCLF